eukprot:gene25018-30517_t
MRMPNKPKYFYEICEEQSTPTAIEAADSRATVVAMQLFVRQRDVDLLDDAARKPQRAPSPGGASTRQSSGEVQGGLTLLGDDGEAGDLAEDRRAALATAGGRPSVKVEHVDQATLHFTPQMGAGILHRDAEDVGSTGGCSASRRGAPARPWRTDARCWRRSTSIMRGDEDSAITFQAELPARIVDTEAGGEAAALSHAFTECVSSTTPGPARAVNSADHHTCAALLGRRTMSPAQGGVPMLVDRSGSRSGGRCALEPGPVPVRAGACAGAGARWSLGRC